MIEGRDFCPVDGIKLQLVVAYDGHHGEAVCTCGARYQVKGKFKPEDARPMADPTGRRPVLAWCPYDEGGLQIVNRYSYASMARYRCETPTCLFEIVQGCVE